MSYLPRRDDPADTEAEFWMLVWYNYPPGSPDHELALSGSYLLHLQDDNPDNDNHSRKV